MCVCCVCARARALDCLIPQVHILICPFSRWWAIIYSIFIFVPVFIRWARATVMNIDITSDAQDLLNGARPSLNADNPIIRMLMNNRLAQFLYDRRKRKKVVDISASFASLIKFIWEINLVWFGNLLCVWRWRRGGEKMNQVFRCVQRWRWPRLCVSVIESVFAVVGYNL